MQNDTTQFVVNLIPLQNIQTNTSGLDATTILSNDVANLQQMVNFEQKRIYTDFLGSYTTGNSIQVLSPLNLSNVGITSNGAATSLGGGGGATSTLTNQSTSLTLFGTTNALSTAIGFSVGSRTVFRLGGTGNGLFYDSGRQATETRISSMNFIADRAELSTLTVSNTGSFGGVCSAQQFITLSDIRTKRDIVRVGSNFASGIDNLHAYTYSYDGESRRDLGLLAQELEFEYPLTISEGPDSKKYLKYDAIVSILVEAVRDLRSRVRTLEEKVGVQ